MRSSLNCRAEQGQADNGLADARGVLVSEEAAKALFDAIRSDPEYLWDFIDDCCLARAHKMCAALKKLGVYTEKIRADNASGTWLGTFGLAVRQKDRPGGFLFMGFHIAPLVRVRTGASFAERVLDPALFDGPVSVDQWAAALINRDSIRPGGSVDPALQDKDFTRLPHDVFELVLHWRNKDDNLEKTEAMLAAHRWEYERRRAAARGRAGNGADRSGTGDGPTGDGPENRSENGPENEPGR